MHLISLGEPQFGEDITLVVVAVRYGYNRVAQNCKRKKLNVSKATQSETSIYTAHHVFGMVLYRKKIGYNAPEMLKPNI